MKFVKALARIQMIPLLALALTSGLANASEPHDYDRIVEALQAYDSDNFYSITPAEIDAILANPGHGYYSTVLYYTQKCDAEARAACKDGRLEARFLGQIQNLNYSQDSEAGNMPHTTFGIGKFKSFSPNPFCPLDVKQAEKASFWVQGQTILHNDQEVAGSILFNSNTGNFTLQGVQVTR